VIRGRQGLLARSVQSVPQVQAAQKVIQDHKDLRDRVVKWGLRAPSVTKAMSVLKVREANPVRLDQSVHEVRQVLQVQRVRLVPEAM
jgi:hypothetical protein